MRRAVLLFLITLLSMDVFPQAQKRSRTTNTWRTRAKVYEPLIASTAERYNVDPNFLWTIAYLESRFRHNAVSYKDGKPCAYGLMQFTDATALRYGLTNPHNPRESLDAAARYVRDLQTRFGPRVDLILAAYNAGEGTVEAFGTAELWCCRIIRSSILVGSAPEAFRHTPKRGSTLLAVQSFTRI